MFYQIMLLLAAFMGGTGSDAHQKMLSDDLEAIL
jgi:hypothetical protein